MFMAMARLGNAEHNVYGHGKAWTQHSAMHIGMVFIMLIHHA
jgi:hypothetical protein